MISTFFFIAILTSFPKPDGITSWGTPYIIAPATVTEIHQKQKNCMENALSIAFDRVEDLRMAVTDCDSKNPTRIPHSEIYYFYTGQDEAGESPFSEFNFCLSMQSGMWDFPPEYSINKYREDLHTCLSTFPSM